MGRRAQGTDITLHGGPAGEFGRGLVYGGLEKALEMAPFSTEALLRIMGGVRSLRTLRDN